MAMKEKTNTPKQREKMHNQAIKSNPPAERKRTGGDTTEPSST